MRKRTDGNYGVIVSNWRHHLRPRRNEIVWMVRLRWFHEGRLVRTCFAVLLVAWLSKYDGYDDVTKVRLV